MGNNRLLTSKSENPATNPFNKQLMKSLPLDGKNTSLYFTAPPPYRDFSGKIHLEKNDH